MEFDINKSPSEIALWNNPLSSESIFLIKEKEKNEKINIIFGVVDDLIVI